MIKEVILALAMSTSLSGIYAHGWHTTPDKWEEPRVFHSEFNPDYDARIRISRSTLNTGSLEKYGQKESYSPNKSYWFVLFSPNTMQPGPWSTEIFIFNERENVVKIELLDHATQYVTTVKWINTKLLYIQFWWGRILGTYFIFDVEQEKVVVREMVHDGSIPFQQWQRNRQK
jgi:hypothetical protein